MNDTSVAGPAGRLVYGVYAWIALLLALVPALVCLVITPGRARRRRVTRWFAQVFFVSIGSPIRADGLAALPDEACIVVANHSSYLDGMILTAALPARFTFVIKQEMASFPFAGFLLRRIGSEFVNRDDGQQRNLVTRRLFKAAQSGDALAFFPEGTFDRRAGLRPFRPGAFGAAWRAGLSVVPVVIFGARRKLPAGVWLPAPGPLSIAVEQPLEPRSYVSSGELMHASRQAILKRLREPDLAGEAINDDSGRPRDDP